MMKDLEPVLTEISKNLELIAEAILKVTVGNVPAFVKVAQDVLDSANKVVVEAVTGEIEEIVADAPAVIKKADGKAMINSATVSSLVAKKTKGISIGDTGVIIDDNDGIGVWRTVVFKTSKHPIKMRCGEISLLTGDAQPPSDEVAANEEDAGKDTIEDSSDSNEDSGVSPDASSAEGANYAFTAGAHKNNTVHGIFTGSDRGAKFITWSAEKHKDEAAKAACASYLKVVNL
jgi:hypothetical protein